jgi:hypothetical protein
MDTNAKKTRLNMRKPPTKPVIEPSVRRDATPAAASVPSRGFDEPLFSTMYGGSRAEQRRTA